MCIRDSWNNTDKSDLQTNDAIIYLNLDDNNPTVKRCLYSTSGADVYKRQVQKGTSKRSMKFIGKCKKDSSKQVILTVEQEASTYTSVSYTHLDVYKRQTQFIAIDNTKTSAITALEEVLALIK